MKKVLLVDDDDFKLKKISSFVSNLLPEAQLFSAKSYSSGVAAAIDFKPDLILLDMQMPTFDTSEKEDGGVPMHFAGLELMFRLKKRRIKTDIIIVTQFESFGEGRSVTSLDSLKNKIANEFPDLYLGIVQYRGSDIQWQIELKRLIEVGHEHA